MVHRSTFTIIPRSSVHRGGSPPGFFLRIAPVSPVLSALSVSVAVPSCRSSLKAWSNSNVSAAFLNIWSSGSGLTTSAHGPLTFFTHGIGVFFIRCASPSLPGVFSQQECSSPNVSLTAGLSAYIMCCRILSWFCSYSALQSLFRLNDRDLWVRRPFFAEFFTLPLCWRCFNGAWGAILRSPLVRRRPHSFLHPWEEFTCLSHALPGKAPTVCASGFLNCCVLFLFSLLQPDNLISDVRFFAGRYLVRPHKVIFI